MNSGMNAAMMKQFQAVSLLGALWFTLLPSPPPFRILEASQSAGTDPDLVLVVGVNEVPQTYEDYRNIFCRVICTANLGTLRSQGITRNRVGDYPSFRIHLYLGMDPPPPFGMDYAPNPEQEERVLGGYWQSHTGASLFMSRERGRPRERGDRNAVRDVDPRTFCQAVALPE